MKRDADLVRAICLAVEALPPNTYLQEMPNVDPHLFAHHVELLVNAGYLEGKVQRFFGPEAPHAVAMRLTWAGCDFLDAARNDTLWKRAKESVIKPSASWTFDLLKEWLKAEIANGLPTLQGVA